MACENNHLVAEVLQANCGVDDQAFCPTDAQIWVKEDHILWFGCSLRLLDTTMR